MPESGLHQNYHDFHYGFPIENDNELFGRFLLEINQAGLSWTTILKKQENFRNSYAEFDVGRIAGFGEQEINRLMSDTGIIRNRRKIEAVIFNAGRVLKIQFQYGSFHNWLHFNRRLELKDWVILFRQNFKFTGLEIVREFLMSTGILPGAHLPECPVFEKTRMAGAIHFKES